MRIAIEAQRLFRYKKHGMDIVALELIKGLQKLDKSNEYFIFVKKDKDNNCLKNTGNFSITQLPSYPFPYWEQVLLPKTLEKYNPDIVHYTANTAPINSPAPYLLTLHDIIYLESLEFLFKNKKMYQKLGNLYRRFVVPQIVKKAGKICTVSGFEKNNICRYFNLPENKVEVIYNGVGQHFFRETPKEELLAFKTKKKLPPEYFFFLGNTDPKKNLTRVLEAYLLYLEMSHKKLHCCIADITKEDILKIISTKKYAKLKDHVILPGYINNEDILHYYEGAFCFLYPSIRESFGIPILEAMACGCPVITSNKTSMPEIAGDNALFINPDSSKDIAQKMVSIEKDHNLYISLIQKGKEHAKNFNWHNTAKHVLAQYTRLNSF